MARWEKLPRISGDARGKRRVGERGPFAEVLWSRGTPPVHGLDAKTIDAERVAHIRHGDRLTVERVGDRWEVSNAVGRLGMLRWRVGDMNRPHAQTGDPIVYPDRGVLHVMRALISEVGTVLDIGGTVFPSSEASEPPQTDPRP